MEIKYFPGTDTLLINFADGEIIETVDAIENALIELGEGGELVSVTVEHVNDCIDAESFSYRKMAAESA